MPYSSEFCDDAQRTMQAPMDSALVSDRITAQEGDVLPVEIEFFELAGNNLACAELGAPFHPYTLESHRIALYSTN